MHALVRFANIAAGNQFTTLELYPFTLDALGCSSAEYSLSSLRYDLSKLRAKRLVEKIDHSRRYRLLPKGYSICLVFLKLFERVYARSLPDCSLPLQLIPDFKRKSDHSSTGSING
jgi:hypothetical protein